MSARPAEQRLGDALLLRLADLARVELDVLVAGATPEHGRQLVAAHVEDLADALADARDLVISLDRAPPGARASEQDPLGFAEAPAATRRELSDEELERLGAALLTRAERRRHAAALEAAAAPLLIKLRDAERRLV
ncbi:MAG: hypothetical protein IT370_33990 [Deltaproteobacteria bacterium]|nr:hypothetical protein [Deltaproteobacteria bacterium]